MKYTIIITIYNKEKYKIEDDNTYNSVGLCIGDLGLYYGNKIIADNYEGKDLSNKKGDKNATVFKYAVKIILSLTEQITHRSVTVCVRICTRHKRTS